MLQLKNITKTYVMGDMQIEALRGIDLDFRANDFVSVLGPSGCGKTTLLNIIGGLDRYSGGGLTINGVSTKEYKDVDWDIYRNNSIGFVFQSYNLISHQTVYTNVELALTLAGISRAERNRRVVEVLEKVGLGDQIYKKPTQMSGGQMQRVAIARALVNNPDILLADEPTGALDSETSLQIMELLKEIAKDRLVIMVTHNQNLAEMYSTRIIRLLDGKVIDDSNPVADAGAHPLSAHPHKTTDGGEIAAGKRKKISMSFTTALNLSFKNLMTKKTRTILTAFAGSIGIIGIALILSLSSGMQDYVNNLERDTLSQYPIEITAISMDMGGMMTVMMEHNRRGDRPEREQNMIHANNIMRNMMRTAGNQIQRNDLAAFKAHIESAEGALFHEFSNTIKYGYDVELQIFTAGGDLQVNPSDVFARLGMGGPGGGMGFGIGGMGGNIWTEMLDNDELLRSQYDVIAGDWPSAFDELVLVVNRRNELNDMVLYSLGLLDAAEIDELMGHLMRGEEIEPSPERSFTYQEILDLTFRLLLNTDYFVRSDFNENGVGIWEDKRENEEHMAAVIENALELRVVGIIRPNENAQATSINGSVAYLSSLTEFVINAVLETEIAGEQLANPETNVFTGLAFGDMGLGVEPSAGSAGGGVNGAPLAPPTYTALPPMGDMPAMGEMPSMGDMPQTGTMPPGGMGAMGTLAGAMGDFGIEVPATFEGNLAILGVADLDNPTSIRLFPRDFDSKQRLEELIEAYNNKHLDAGNDDYVINYTDIVGLMTSSISQIINIISYVLIAFVAISLVVSSIMIAIITYISVLERTKEIGILRSIGASKRDITRVFNAETVIEGFVAGTMGIAITLILNIPINAIILNLTDITNLSVLPFYGAIALIIISIILTLIAGYIPSKMAAKKDPVVALRTE